MAVQVDTTKTDRFFLPLSIGRLNPSPNDGSYVWATMADAQTYAASDPTAYVGQLIYVQETNKVYKIENVEGTLKEVGSGIASLKPFLSINQLADYLFEVQYPVLCIDYDYARDYFEHAQPSDYTPSGCTGIYKDKKVFRNLDWYYGNGAEFVVHVPADIENSRLASVGMSSGTTGLTRAVVESGVANDKYKIMPFTMTDGVNSAGLYMQSNVVPLNGITYDINPTASETIYIPMLIRFLLDRATSIADVDALLSTTHIKSTPALTFGYHLMVAQGTQWAIYEFTANSWTKVTSDTLPFGIMSNFRTTGIVVDPDTGELDWNSVEQYGIGLERYELALQAFSTTSPKTFAQLRGLLKYSNLYSESTDPLWRTEFSGETDPTDPTHKLTVSDAKLSPEKFIPIFITERQKWADKTREDGQGTWHTVHNAIYDLEAKSFILTVQERFGEEFTIFLAGNSIIEEAKAYADSARTSAAQASASMVAAMNSETIATQKANNAAISATQAESHATNAATSAVTAAQTLNQILNTMEVLTRAQYDALPRPLPENKRYIITD